MNNVTRRISALRYAYGLSFWLPLISLVAVSGRAVSREVGFSAKILPAIGKERNVTETLASLLKAESRQPMAIPLKAINFRKRQLPNKI